MSGEANEIDTDLCQLQCAVFGKTKDLQNKAKRDRGDTTILKSI